MKLNHCKPQHEHDTLFEIDMSKCGGMALGVVFKGLVSLNSPQGKASAHYKVEKGGFMFTYVKAVRNKVMYQQ
jgi:hypothetical protein